MFLESLIGLIVLGLVLGVVHAFEADHIAAVATFGARTEKPKEAAIIGAWWGAGHTSILFFFGGLMLIFGRMVPETISGYLEVIVGTMLVFLGANILWKVRKEKLHIHTHAHDGKEHIHVHSHRKTTLHLHTHASLFTGLVHGLAGTGALLVLTLALTAELKSSLFFMFSFGVGSILGMTALAASIGFVMSIAKNSAKLAQSLQIGAGSFSLSLGIFVIFTHVV